MKKGFIILCFLISANGLLSQSANNTKLGYEAYDKLHIPTLTVLPKNRPVVVAVVDDGFRLSHKALQPYIFINKDEIPDNGKDDDNNGFTDDISGWDISDHDNDVSFPKGREGDYYHGKMIAGIITILTEKCFGVNNPPAIKILPVKVLSDRANSTYLKDGYEGIEYAVNMNADIICCAWSGGFLDEKYRHLFDEAAKRGITIIASAGNMFSEKITPPASVSTVFAVASVDTALHKMYNSNYGKKIDLVGFGEFVKAPYLDKDNAYTYSSGTSSAVALVSGCAAAIKAMYPSLEPTEIVKALRNTAHPVDAVNTVFAGKLGAGLPDLTAALKYIAAPSERDQYFNTIRTKGDIHIHQSTVRRSWEITPVGGIHSIDFLLIGNKKQQKKSINFYTKDSLYKSVQLTPLFSKISVPGGYARVEFVGKPDKTPVEISYVANPIDSSTLYCNDIKYYETPVGDFSDGSGENDYANNAACKWQIKVDKTKHVKLEFDQLDTQGNADFVYVYSGTETLSENLLAKFSGQNIPPKVVSPGNEVLIWFVTDKAVSGKGWHISYSSVEDEPGFIFPNKKE